MRLSNNDMRKLMRQMGLDAQELIEAESVIILSTKGKITIEKPQVVKFVVQGQTMYQILGGSVKVQTGQESSSAAMFTDEDVRFVASQSGQTVQRAREALAESRGDVAEALLKLANPK